jgi:uncharacterized membrane protein
MVRFNAKLLMQTVLLMVITFGLFSISEMVNKVFCATWSVYGTVVDERGIGLSDVLVEAYSSNGAFIDSTRTQSDGYFTLPLENGSYRLCFSKPGYVKVEKSLTVRSNMNISTIVLSRAIKLYTSTLKLTANLGSKVVIPFTISNIGDSDETLELLVYKPSNWLARVLDQSNHEVSEVYIPASTKQNFQLEISIPSTAQVNSEYGIAVAAIGTLKTYMTITVYVESAITVSGRLIDEFGNAVRNATVDVYSYDGLPITSVNSDSNGYFTVELEASKSFILCFSKPGYAKYSKTITVGDESVNIGDITLQKSIKLYGSILTLTTEPGQKLLIPLTVTNNGEEYEIVELSTVSPKDWITRIITQSNQEASKFTLAPKTSLNLQLEVTIPFSTAIGEYPLKVIAIGSANSSLELTIKVQPLSVNVISCQFPGKTITPGGTVKFQLKIRNPTDVEQRFSFSINPQPPGWLISVKSSSGETVSDVELDGGGSVDLIVEISTPSTVNSGEYYFTFSAESQNISESLPLRLIVERPKPCIELTATPPYLDVYAGSSARFKLVVSNTGGYDQLLNLTVESSPEGLNIRFEDSNKQEITKVYVEAGKSKEFYVVASIPKGFKLGIYNFTVSVSNSDVRKFASLILNVLGVYEITVTNQNFYTSLNVGGEGTFDLTVKNTGTQDVTNVRVVAVAGSIPNGFSVNIAPNYIASLKTDEEATFTITITTEADVNAGNYYIDFNVLSDQAEAKSFTLRVEVFHETSWILYGGILIVAAVIGLIIIYRRFGRR